jgi:isopenicillin N synthase-like dioxygenase
MTASAAVPVIDISAFIAGGHGAADVVRAVEQAGRNLGFLLVTGHGVSPEVTDRLYGTARAFFDEPHDWKVTQGRKTGVMGGMAYSPIAEEALAATKGIKTPGDFKESLNYGRGLTGDAWAARPPGLERAFQDYFAEMEVLSAHMRRIFCSAIGLAPDHFEQDFVNHLSALRVINYPEQTVPPEPGQLRAGVHTDYGVLTILRSEASPGGLQVQNRNGEWLDAPSVEGAFVINIADTFMRWTNDEWVSTPHRVANPPAGYAGRARRQSIPFFLNPAKDALIECLPAYVGSGAKYDPITFEDYIALKTSQAFGKP